MTKRLIREDKIGIFCYVDGYIARPLNSTQYRVGQKVKARHIGGTPTHVIGDECWLSAGTQYEDRTITQRQYKRDWYVKHCSHLV